MDKYNNDALADDFLPIVDPKVWAKMTEAQKAATIARAKGFGGAAAFIDGLESDKEKDR